MTYSSYLWFRRIVVPYPIGGEGCIGVLFSVCGVVAAADAGQACPCQERRNIFCSAQYAGGGGAGQQILARLVPATIEGSDIVHRFI